jgi:hypothetical protein
MSSIIESKRISGFDIKTYCKIEQTRIGDEQFYRCNFTFGTGRRKFCMTAAYNIRSPNGIYIDRVENNNVCVIGDNLSSITDGTAKLVRIGLYAMKDIIKEIPLPINRFTLNDDSHIYCNGQNGPKISLAYDTILKYNQTWYQYKFGAVLPGFISYGSDDEKSNNAANATKINIPLSFTEKNVKKTIVYTVTKDSLMEIYLNSLKILDDTCEPYEDIIKSFSIIKNYEAEYKSINTSRKFIATLREKFGKQFCNEIFRWYNSYMQYLHINIYHEAWYIPIEHVKEPLEYNKENVDSKNTEQIWNGGKWNGGKWNDSKSNTRKNSKKIVWGIMPFTQEYKGGYMGTWENLE